MLDESKTWEYLHTDASKSIATWSRWHSGEPNTVEQQYAVFVPYNKAIFDALLVTTYNGLCEKQGQFDFPEKTGRYSLCALLKRCMTNAARKVIDKVFEHFSSETDKYIDKCQRPLIPSLIYFRNGGRLPTIPVYGKGERGGVGG